MNAKRLVLIGAAVLAVVVAPGCAESPDTADVPHSEDAHHSAAAGSDTSRDVGGSYNKEGVAPFGMVSRKPVAVPDAVVDTAGASDAAAAGLLADQSATFATHCQSCHGADGQGVEPLGVTLVNSPFVKSKSADELVAMLKVGRLPGDPDSVKQRVMPGFSWMEEAQLSELADLLKAQN